MRHHYFLQNLFILNILFIFLADFFPQPTFQDYFFFCLNFSETICGYHEKKLLFDLLQNYNQLERPVVNESSPLLLTFGVTLQQIIDVVSR